MSLGKCHVSFCSDCNDEMLGDFRVTQTEPTYANDQLTNPQLLNCTLTFSRTKLLLLGFGFFPFQNQRTIPDVMLPVGSTCTTYITLRRRLRSPWFIFLVRTFSDEVVRLIDFAVKRERKRETESAGRPVPTACAVKLVGQDLRIGRFCTCILEAAWICRLSWDNLESNADK